MTFNDGEIDGYSYGSLWLIVPNDGYTYIHG